EIDVTSVFKDLAKHTVEIRDVDRVPELLQRAIDISVADRPGPVVVSIPENLQTAASLAVGRAQRTQPVHPGVSPDVLRRIQALFNAAERPVAVVGGGVRAARANAALIRFIEATGMPVVQGWRRSDAFP